MSALVGKWDLQASENFEDYMKALGVGFATRKMAASIKPTVHISQDNTNWKLKVESTFKTSEIAFVDGVEFAEESMDGRKCKSTIRSDGPNKLVQEQRDAASGTLATTITREVDSSDLLRITYVAGDVTASRTFKRS